MKLLSSPASPFGRKVKVALIERGLIDRVRIEAVVTSPSQPNAELSRDNPLAKIPVLITDDGRTLFDSLVICDYLDTLHSGARLIPSSGPTRWDVLTAHALASGLAEAAVLCRYEEALRPEARRWPEWTAGQMAKVNQAIDWLETHAERLGDAAAPAVDIAQIAAACALGYLDFRFARIGWRSRSPRLDAWFARFGQRPSMQQSMPPAS